FFLSRSFDQPNLHSFPTRRSSDLNIIKLTPDQLDINNDKAGFIREQIFHPFKIFKSENRGRTKYLNEFISEEVKTAIEECTRFEDRKSTRLNSSHVSISYAVFCLK